MDKLIAGFSNQLSKALEIGNNYQFKLGKNIQIDNILIIGLGGSGIGGSLLQNYAFDKVKVPVYVSKAYTLPAFIGKNTLTIICSYSGNTEETVTSYRKALEVGCPIVTVTSGGIVAALAKENNNDCILIPPGFPPRSCLGYSFVQLLTILNHFELISNQYLAELNDAITLIDTDNDNIKNLAQEIAHKIAFKTPVIYIENNMEAMAIRWRQQFNENGKMLCWHHVVPEMNHNELVGWRDKTDERAVLFLRNEVDYERSQLRMDLNIETISQYTSNIIQIFSKGNSYLENAIYLSYLGDWISWYLSVERNFNATEVNVIDQLKANLNH